MNRSEESHFVTNLTLANLTFLNNIFKQLEWKMWKSSQFSRLSISAQLVAVSMGSLFNGIEYNRGRIGHWVDSSTQSNPPKVYIKRCIFSGHLLRSAVIQAVVHCCLGKWNTGGWSSSPKISRKAIFAHKLSYINILAKRNVL